MQNVIQLYDSKATKTPKSLEKKRFAEPRTAIKKSRKMVWMPYYPPVLMPEQPAGYLKPRKYDFF